MTLVLSSSVFKSNISLSTNCLFYKNSIKWKGYSIFSTFFSHLLCNFQATICFSSNCLLLKNSIKCDWRLFSFFLASRFSSTINHFFCSVFLILFFQPRKLLFVQKIAATRKAKNWVWWFQCFLPFLMWLLTHQATTLLLDH